MSVGVAVLHDESIVLDEVAHALDRIEGAHVVGLNETPTGVDAILAGGRALDDLDPAGAGLVVLATGDPVTAARRGFALSASALVVWPDDAADLGRAVAVAASRSAKRRGAARGTLVAVLGARGGAGATTIAALLARAMPDSLLVDLDTRGAGQLAFAPDGVETDGLERVLRSPSPDVVASRERPHAAGRALYTRPWCAEPDKESLAAALEAARYAAPVVVVDAGRLSPGAAEWADRRIVVCADDLASLRAARAYLDAGAEADFIVNRRRRRGLRAAHAERALGRRPAAVIPPDRRLARAADLGLLPGRVPRSLAAVANGARA